MSLFQRRVRGVRLNPSPLRAPTWEGSHASDPRSGLRAVLNRRPNNFLWKRPSAGSLPASPAHVRKRRTGLPSILDAPHARLAENEVALWEADADEALLGEDGLASPRGRALGEPNIFNPLDTIDPGGFRDIENMERGTLNVLNISNSTGIQHFEGLVI